VSISERLLQAHGTDLVEEPSRDGVPTFRVAREKIEDVCRFLRKDETEPMDMLMDLCGVDYRDRQDRFEVVYQLFNTPNHVRIRLKTSCPESDPSVPSVYGVWKGADWFEREVFDMYGVSFSGHPDLRRLLTGEYFKGHPLRKDYEPGKRFPVTEADIYRPPAGKADEGDFETMLVNVGPTHPAMHGTFRVMARLDGEKIVWADTEIGYLHRCFEKMSETHNYQQVIPYTDRLNYCSSFLNNVAYTKTIEEMMGLEIPERTQAVRVILGEFSRIMDHCVCLGTNLVDLGALTNYWYYYQIREEIYTLLEKCCGARLTTAYTRIGGLSKDIPEDFGEMVDYLLKIIPPLIDDVDKIVTKNRIFQMRTMGVGGITPENAIEWGWTGPCLRAAGVPYDVRKAFPYYGYDRYDWEVPVGTTGDTFDRYTVRMEEIRQSLRIIRQAADSLPGGPIMVDDPRVHLPGKDEVYNTMEGLIYHFEKVMFGLTPPEGDWYGFSEGANGELGFYVVSDGTPNPYRVRCRPPCFAIYQAFREMLEGHMVADIVAILGSLNVIAGELDR